jgi:7-cyano-7-deazaguanine synthase in queuosine biosynthesis
MADRILAFSGGMDSYMLKRMHKFSDAECVFVEMGTRENRREAGLLDKLFPDVQRVQLPLVQWELPNKIIPFRNTFLALTLAQLAPSLYFAFTAGDTTRDKDYVFKAEVEGMLNYFAGVPEKAPFGDARYEVHMPFKPYTKRELVRQFIDAGFSVEELRTRTVSCYEGTPVPCGECRSCVRKYVALAANGIKCEGWFYSDPRKQLSALLDESIRKNRKHETEDILLCTSQKQQ